MGSKHIVKVWFIVFFMCCNAAMHAQDLSRYVINIQNGLPSNHAYFPLVNSYGYLWISTERGVMKYNGYNTRIFNKQSGIANDDIWLMFEDARKRIWLSSISNEIGYVYNNTYKKIYTGNTHSFYSNLFINNKEGGISFFNGALRSDAYNSIDVERNDTLFSTPLFAAHMILLRPDGRIFINHHHENFEVKRVGNQWERTPTIPYPSNYCYSDSMSGRAFSCGDYFVTYHREEGPLYTFNVFTGKFDTVDVQARSGDKVITFNAYGSHPKLIMANQVIAFGSDMKPAHVYPGSQLLGQDFGKQSIRDMLIDSLWGTVATTADNGVYISLDENKFCKLNSPFADGYEYKGQSATGKQYWWHPRKRILAQLDRNGVVRIIKHNVLTKVIRIKPKDSTHSVILGNTLFFIDDNDLKLEVHSDRFDHFGAKIIGQPITYSKFSGKWHHIVYDYLELADTTHYFVNAAAGLERRRAAHDTLFITQLAETKITGMTADTVLRLVWAYGFTSVFLFDPLTDKKYRVPEGLLKAFGITKVEQLQVDRYHNIYIKDNGRLLVFNDRTRTIKKLFPNYRLDDAVVAIHGDHLAVVGSLGVLFCRIKGAMQFSKEVVYRNIKHANYNYLLGKEFAFSDDSVAFGADYGAYSVAVPREYPDDKSRQNDFRLLWYYKDSIQQMHNNDTINISHDELNIRLDVVNPKGYGTPVYSYKISNGDGEWHVLNSNELHFEDLKPDTYYDMWVRVNDYEWRSDAVLVKVYLQPRWWESYYGRRFVWLGIAILIIGVGFGIAYITKQIVDKRNRDRNTRLELKNLRLALELKSIYAQINPHFIFNTLSTGLYFIKKGMMKEAYRHITTFSDLLRSFLKASRNKYINLEEDIENLENYIQLQQTRFENRFEYEIDISPDINTEATLVPSLLLQPIVENAIHHGLFHKEGLGHLYLGFENKTGDELVCVIDDDGIGREQSRILKETTVTRTQSYGTDMVKELINTLNQHEPILISIEYIDKQLPETGTRVVITIKYLNNAT
jgi:two-component sensor histidine kinase